MDRYDVSGLEVFRFVFAPVKSNMYLIFGNGEAIAIDPHVCTEAFELIRARGTEKVTILLTHEHPDHTSGVKRMREAFPGSLICQENCAKSLADPRNNRPILISFVLAEQDKANGTKTAEEFNKAFEPYACTADVTFENELKLECAGHALSMTATPGHSRGSCCIIVDGKAVFTGDSLIPNVEVITRFPGGSLESYRSITRPFLESLNQEMKGFPGHRKPFKMGDILPKSL